MKIYITKKKNNQINLKIEKKKYNINNNYIFYSHFFKYKNLKLINILLKKFKFSKNLIKCLILEKCQSG